MEEIDLAAQTLVGTLAFQTYAGLLGVQLGRRPLMTQDADFAQFWGISCPL